ncbi:class I SAM-dependent methyltransferase [Rhodoligotrophos defluvii]|uniref:class I SAM-dependent methyltransferase n=1 Tax=Rhodoligotrophos defluvii TaxID=2561934 RepID=UPI0010C9A7A8|nr:class I SAM-dependent methyltransferase [Rhodoligotrophos defluvii]
MSRLDSFINRVIAQRECLNAACAEIAGREGVVFELGLGNGRTFDHLRERLPGREIFVFERSPAAHPKSMPDEAHLIIGDVTKTLPAAVERFAGRVVLLHSDLGSADLEENARLARFLSGTIPPLLAEGAIVLCDPALDLPRAERLQLPPTVQKDRYYMYRWKMRAAQPASAIQESF